MPIQFLDGKILFVPTLDGPRIAMNPRCCCGKMEFALPLIFYEALEDVWWEMQLQIADPVTGFNPPLLDWSTEIDISNWFYRLRAESESTRNPWPQGGLEIWITITDYSEVQEATVFKVLNASERALLNPYTCYEARYRQKSADWGEWQSLPSFDTGDATEGILGIPP